MVQIQRCFPPGGLVCSVLQRMPQWSQSMEGVGESYTSEPPASGPNQMHYLGFSSQTKWRQFEEQDEDVIWTILCSHFRPGNIIGLPRALAGSQAYPLLGKIICGLHFTSTGNSTNLKTLKEQPGLQITAGLWNPEAAPPRWMGMGFISSSRSDVVSVSAYTLPPFNTLSLSTSTISIATQRASCSAAFWRDAHLQNGDAVEL
jgi:hypothetical protein